MFFILTNAYADLPYRKMTQTNFYTSCHENMGSAQ